MENGSEKLKAKAEAYSEQWVKPGEGQGKAVYKLHTARTEAQPHDS